MAPFPVFLAGLLGLASLTLFFRLRHMAAGHLALASERDRARMAEAAGTRLARLAADELRNTTLALLGHAERLRYAGSPDAAGHAVAIAAATTQLLGLADILQDNAVPTAETRVLDAERLHAAPLIADAVAGVAASLGPGRRRWLVSPALDDLVLLADRRALVQVLQRVLANAARFTREGDCIEIGLQRSEAGLAIVVADEGAGPGASPGAAGARAEARGIGLGLALARVLMEAHGGGLAVEAAARVGTRVTLGFPAGRVLPRERAAA
jgi:two-component system cell cycle sensor histidine kinase PleC